MSSIEFHKSCLICGLDRLNELPAYQDSFLCQCHSCSFVFAKRIPTEQELIDHYGKYARNDYLSPITIKRYHELLDSFEPYRKTGRILDVGCGIGYFLEEAKKRGWKVFGTEYTDDAVEICRGKGIDMKQGKLNPEDFSAESFDVITSFEVIEHINNPIEEVQNFNTLLRKGGLVYLTTPNFNSLLRYRLKADYNVISYPEHLSYYTPQTIKKLFKKCGFSTKRIQTTGISLTRLRTSTGKSDQQFISKDSDDEAVRNKIESKWYLGLAKNLVNGALSIFGVGDSLKGRFIKN